MSDGAFLGYIALLAISGIVLVVLAVGGFAQSVGVRAIDALFGVGFLSYAFYLLFIFDGGDVRVFFYAFAVPVLAIAKVIKTQWAKQDQKPAIAYGPPARPAPLGGPAPNGQVGVRPSAFGQPASVIESLQDGPAHAYVAPVFNGRSGHVVETSPYGRYVPGELIGNQPIPPVPVPQQPAR
jgi:hypothetical protein